MGFPFPSVCQHPERLGVTKLAYYASFFKSPGRTKFEQHPGSGAETHACNKSALLPHRKMTPRDEVKLSTKLRDKVCDKLCEKV